MKICCTWWKIRVMRSILDIRMKYDFFVLFETIIEFTDRVSISIESIMSCVLQVNTRSMTKRFPDARESYIKFREQTALELVTVLTISWGFPDSCTSNIVQEDFSRNVSIHYTVLTIIVIVGAIKMVQQLVLLWAILLFSKFIITAR